MTTTDTPPAIVPALPSARPRRPRLRRARRRLLRMVRVSHRWVALLLGLLLLVVTTSGATLLYKPEIERKLHPSLYHATRSLHPVDAAQALRIVEHGRPAFGAVAAGRVGRVWGVPNADYSSYVYVDPGTGHINGQRGNDGVFRFLSNLHECALSCKGDPGYIAALGSKMPGLGVPGLRKVTVASFILGVAGLAFIVLIAGGLVLWWPGVRRWRRGLQVRRAQGAYKRNYDLHKLVGFVALPFLAMWAFTGTNFELPVLRNVTDALLPGKTDEDAGTLTSAKAAKGTPDISEAEAQAAARRLMGGGRVVTVTPPAKDDPTSTWSFVIDKGFNWWRAYPFAPGGKFVSVDRHDASRARDTWHTDDAAQALYGKQSEAAHFGSIAGWAPRLLLLAMGLVPLLLAFTGTATWLHRLSKRRVKRRTALA